MSHSEFKEFADRLLNEQPTPPRSYPRRLMLKHVINPWVALLALFCLFGGGGALYYMYMTVPGFGPMGSNAFLFWFITFYVSVIGFLPLYRGWVRDYGLRKGLVGFALITHKQRMRYYDVYSGDVMVGDRRFSASLGMLDNTHRVGEMVRVLVHPRGKRILLVVE